MRRPGQPGHRPQSEGERHMGIVYVLLPATLLLAALAVWAFLWAARGRQFESLDTAASRPLMDRDVTAAGPTDPTPDTPGREANGHNTRSRG